MTDRQGSTGNSVEAGPDFYSPAYYLTQCGGHEQFATFDGGRLGPIWQMAVDLANPGPGQLVLDVGCGRGEVVLVCALTGARAIGVDFSPSAVAIARGLLEKSGVGDRSTIIRMDAGRLGFRSRQFDTILMLDFVEHVAQDKLKRVISHCHSLLKPGGRLIVHTGPTREFIRYGQHVKRLLYAMGRKPVPAAITLEGEARLAGHCNLHSRESLLDALAIFESKRVEYEFSVRQGRLKRFIHSLGLTRFVAFNLWGIGTKGSEG